MSSTHSCDPLLTSQDDEFDGELTPPSSSSGSISSAFQWLHSAESRITPAAVERERALTSYTDSISSTPPLSATEWQSDTLSETSEAHLLLDDDPTGHFSRVETAPAISSSFLTYPYEKDPPPQSHKPNAFVPYTDDTPTTPKDIKIKVQQKEPTLPDGERCKTSSHSCYQVVIVIAFVAIFTFSTVATFLAVQRGRSGMFFGCRTTDFVSRNYQMQTPEHFDFSQSKQQNSGLPRRFSGTVRVLTGPRNQKDDLNVSITSTVSDLWGQNIVAGWRPSRFSSCAEASLYFRPGLEISSFKVAAQKLNLILSSDLLITDKTTISLNNGVIVSQKFPSSREIYIDTKSTRISGTFKLLDLLSIKTASGSLSIDINAQNALKGPYKPAVLNIESKSGAVDIKYPGRASTIPDREYHSTIVVRSGSVRGRLIHGKKTVIDIKSGNLNLQILPYAAQRGSSALTTKMASGFSRITVLQPTIGAIRNMHSSHSAKSGRLELRYPDEWQGQIVGTAKSGSISLKGIELDVYSQTTKGSNKHVQARKGHGKNKLDFDISSGSVDVKIGA
ncbi:hypothetical protein BT63DRAFT_461188 [Microthyrium microscopicum]|uniref:Uncharacterized protein n=1 Tax=Microthyrium microscopicum TaxID=703497 RepID=A0A6A6TUF2_9PEZI|nr:hypothetical protein BT63DRAFT_461188 [Microthyrium microscopicum]